MPILKNLIYGIILPLLVTSTSAAHATITLPPSMIEASVQISTNVASVDAGLVLTLYNKSDKAILVPVAAGFPVGEIGFTNEDRLSCPLTVAGIIRFKRGVMVNNRSVKIEPGDHLDWSLPIRTYFEPTKGTWLLKGEIELTYDARDRSRVGRVPLPPKRVKATNP